MKGNMNPEKVDAMAYKEHEKWASWMVHLFQKSKHNKTGSVTIPKDLVERWWRQIETGYNDLSEHEKQSDRDVVIEYFGDLPFVNLDN